MNFRVPDAYQNDICVRLANARGEEFLEVCEDIRDQLVPFLDVVEQAIATGKKNKLDGHACELVSTLANMLLVPADMCRVMKLSRFSAIENNQEPEEPEESEEDNRKRERDDDSGDIVEVVEPEEEAAPFKRARTPETFAQFAERVHLVDQTDELATFSRGHKMRTVLRGDGRNEQRMAVNLAQPQIALNRRMCDTYSVVVDHDSRDTLAVCDYEDSLLKDRRNVGRHIATILNSFVPAMRNDCIGMCPLGNELDAVYRLFADVYPRGVVPCDRFHVFDSPEYAFDCTQRVFIAAVDTVLNGKASVWKIQAGVLVPDTANKPVKGMRLKPEERARCERLMEVLRNSATLDMLQEGLAEIMMFDF